MIDVVRGEEDLEFWVPVLGRALAVWCIRMVHLYGGGAAGGPGPDYRGGYLWAGVYVWCIYINTGVAGWLGGETTPTSLLVP